MIEQYTRAYYQKIFVEIPATLIAETCTPNLVTLFSLICGVFVPFALWLGWHAFAVISLLLSGYFDTLDGTVARIRNESTPLGTVLDIVADRVVEVSVILGLYFIHPEANALYAIVMLSSIVICITSFLVVGIFTENQDKEKSFFYSVGIIERAEAFMFFIAMILFPYAYAILAAAFSALVFITAVDHIYRFSLYSKQTACTSSS